MAILLIRHGETALNAARVVQTPETPLSDNGLAQAERLGQRLNGSSITKILSSDYARARMTAEAIETNIGVKIDFSERLRERNFGDFRGTPYSELKVDILDQRCEPPNGESVPVFNERVRLAWQEVKTIAADLHGDLAVVTHGLVLRSLAQYHLANCPDLDESELGFHNTSLTVIEAQAPWRVERFACIDHLHDMHYGGAPV